MNSPIKEFLFEPFDNLLEKKNSLNMNKLAYIQFSILVLVLTIYYYLNNFKDRASILFILSYVFFYKFSKKIKNNDIKLIYDISYLVISFMLIILIINKSNFQNSTSLLVLLLVFLVFVSYAIKQKNFSKSKNKKISDFKKLLKKVCLSIYPESENFSKIKDYHLSKFWGIFDFNLLAVVIFMLLSK